MLSASLCRSPGTCPSASRVDRGRSHWRGACTFSRRRCKAVRFRRPGIAGVGELRIRARRDSDGSVPTAMTPTGSRRYDHLGGEESYSGGVSVVPWAGCGGTPDPNIEEVEMQEWNFIDKSEWPVRGAWDTEPDKAQWIDEATGLTCLAVRNRSHWCGYVGVGPDHRLHGRPYSGCSLDEPCGEDYCDHSMECSFEVHGGLTYSDFCQEDNRERGICHVVEDGEDKLFWFGFDCAHAGDLTPATNDRTHAINQRYRWPKDETYRDLGYVREQCALLARQLKEAA